MMRATCRGCAASSSASALAAVGRSEPSTCRRLLKAACALDFAVAALPAIGFQESSEESVRDSGESNKALGIEEPECVYACVRASEFVPIPYDSKYVYYMCTRNCICVYICICIRMHICV